MPNLIADEPDPRDASGVARTSPLIRMLGLGIPKVLSVEVLLGQVNGESRRLNSAGVSLEGPCTLCWIRMNQEHVVAVSRIEQVRVAI
jgi:hypothetical protein